MLRSLVLLGLGSLLFWGCSTNVASYEKENRGVYLLFSPTKERLAKMDVIKDMFTYIINDMSPGDTLVVDSAGYDPLRIELSKNPELAYKQKRAFRSSLDLFLKQLKPTKTCQIDNALARAKEYLSKKAIKHRSILLCSDAKVLKRRVRELDGMTVSLLNFIDEKKLDLQKLVQKIEGANGKLIVAAQLSDLDKALSYR
ncbi:MAG: hypothetical protein OEW60_04715 [Thiovulaceae bacterium]|nr:hypothetical protein [Sulfurimonadaceae bacterium]